MAEQANTTKKPVVHKEHRYLSIGQLKAKKYETIDLGERFRPLFGLLQTKFVIMFYGESGSGKSVLTLELCEELAGHGKTLYNSHEERDNKTLQDRVNNFKIDSKKITIGVSVPFDEMINKIKRGHYSYVVIDSVQYMAFTYDQLKLLIEVGKRKKKFGIIMVSFGNTEGNPKNAVDHLHASDVKCFFKKGAMHVKSRYLNQPKSVRLFDPKTDNAQTALF